MRTTLGTECRERASPNSFERARLFSRAVRSQKRPGLQPPREELQVQRTCLTNSFERARLFSRAARSQKRRGLQPPRCSPFSIVGLAFIYASSTSITWERSPHPAETHFLSPLITTVMKLGRIILFVGRLANRGDSYAQILTFALRDCYRCAVMGSINSRSINIRWVAGDGPNDRHKVLCACRGLFRLTSPAHFRADYFCLWTIDRLGGVRHQRSLEPSRKPKTDGVSVVPGRQDCSRRNFFKR
jgi:hypothetical protein